jgi:hypothetical protein
MEDNLYTRRGAEWLKFKNRREHAFLSPREEKLKMSVWYLLPVMRAEPDLPIVARQLWKQVGEPDAEECKALLFQAFSIRHIPEKPDQDTADLRAVYSRGSQVLLAGGSLKELTAELGLSWRKSLDLYDQASKIVASNIVPPTPTI